MLVRAPGRESVLAAVPGNEGQHAALCACGECLGQAAKAPDFREVGTRPEGVDEPRDGPGESGPAEDEGGGLASGSYTYAQPFRDFPRVHGQTFYFAANLPSVPKVSWDVSYNILPGPDYDIRPNPVSAPNSPEFKVTVTQAGEYPISSHPDYPDYAATCKFSDMAQQRCELAESQHVSDLDTAWELACLDIVQRLNFAAEEEPHQSDDQVKGKEEAAQAIVGHLGAYGADVAPALAEGDFQSKVYNAMDTAAALSRETRDASGQHTFPMLLEEVDHDRRHVTARIDDAPGLSWPGTPVNNDSIA